MSIDIITGEKIQEICDIYITNNPTIFKYNKKIKNNYHKCINSIDIYDNYDNPKYIFCYTNQIKDFYKKILLFKNKFILISHNSDYNIENYEYIQLLLNSNNLIAWYSQNILFIHPKLKLLPIGIANSIWKHGDLSIFDNIYQNFDLSLKTKDVYFNFSILTNPSKRILCYESLKSKLLWLETISPTQNLIRLKDYKFCICPEGNGVDTHRLWECLYLKVVPIVIKSPFTNILIRYNIPLVILEDWYEFDLEKLDYNYYITKFNSNDLKNILSFSFLKNNILNTS